MVYKESISGKEFRRDEIALGFAVLDALIILVYFLNLNFQKKSIDFLSEKAIFSSLSPSLFTMEVTNLPKSNGKYDMIEKLWLNI